MSWAVPCAHPVRSVALAVEHLPDLLRHLERPRVLELGSRRVTPSAWPRPAYWEVTGVDVRAGPGVDLVADAHALHRALPAASFDAVYSHAVFEHLLMPWVVALQLNHVLRDGGVAWIVTHEAFPRHEHPWDFWRFGPGCWGELFGARTGFEILGSRPLHPARVRALHGSEDFAGHSGCEVQLRKLGAPDPELSWPLTPDDLLARGHEYPAPGRKLRRSVERRARELLRRLRTRRDPDPLRAAQHASAWTVLCGPRARRPAPEFGATATPLGVPTSADVGDASAPDLRAWCARQPDASVRALALLDLVQRDPRPWSLVPELARVLAPDAVLYVDAAFTAPADEPGFRLSAEAFRGLLHPRAGFELLGIEQADPARLIEGGRAAPAPCFLRSLALARRLPDAPDPALRWP